MYERLLFATIFIPRWLEGQIARRYLEIKSLGRNAETGIHLFQSSDITVRSISPSETKRNATPARYNIPFLTRSKYDLAREMCTMSDINAAPIHDAGASIIAKKHSAFRDPLVSLPCYFCAMTDAPVTWRIARCLGVSRRRRIDKRILRATRDIRARGRGKKIIVQLFACLFPSRELARCERMTERYLVATFSHLWS